MTEERVFVGKNQEEVAKEFARLIKDTYQRSLLCLMEMYVDEYEEYAKYNEMLQSQCTVVYERAYKRIKDIMHNPDPYDRHFYKMYGPFKSFHIIEISPNGGFFLDLDDYNEARKFMAANVVYVIDKWRKTITKQHYPASEMSKLL